ncbi:outer membrane lipoprotein chaperone LolA [Sulfurimonas sp. SAG-AH-194-I05]|nr:LolA-like outer membrane lipoprotein chaperone [Sulfurimonas sp. SAG-AH-194-I05]MDF1875602.1 outer membrane lipoprotein chaperone LolA [Sulfurimonas sp. SAG-AH-194-I05]
MKLLFIPLLYSSIAFASLDTIYSFQANFSQTVTDDKNVSISYEGYVQAKKPQNALWNYQTPIVKDIYINQYRVVVVEPEIEQVIIRKIESSFDFFKMIRNAKKINDTTYEAHYMESQFIITIQDDFIQAIAYIDSFENNVKITFTKQKQNIKIDKEVFIADYPRDFDVVGD